MRKLLRDLVWILPTSFVIGFLLSWFGPGSAWWVGWLAYFLLLALGLMGLIVLWRSAGSGRALLVMFLLALFLRLGLGISLNLILPPYGNDTFIHNAGYAFRDAYTYDNEAWDLASSSEPLWRAFDQDYGAEDQYGGLLFLNSLAYRLLSPDAHRPWLISLLSALAGAFSVALGYKGARLAWGEATARISGWIMALYPEALLVGGAQVREAFLVLFTTMAFWGLNSWLTTRKPTAWFWLAGSLVGMLLFSPGVLVAILVGLSLWAWLQQKSRRVSRWWLAGAAGMVLLAALLLGGIVGGTLLEPGGPLANLVNWLRYSADYSAYQTELHSGQIQYFFTMLPNSLHLPFIVMYGVFQPLLPATIFDPAVLVVRVIGIFRGLGWFIFLPFLIYSLRPILKTIIYREKVSWLWLWAYVWLWIIICSFRAGGDQWDNPRYRLILLLFQSYLVAHCIIWTRQNHDPWLGRFLFVELLFVGGTVLWYWSRYDSSPGMLTLGWILILIIALSIVFLLGCIFLDRQKNRFQKNRK